MFSRAAPTYDTVIAISRSSEGEGNPMAASRKRRREHRCPAPTQYYVGSGVEEVSVDEPSPAPSAVPYREANWFQRVMRRLPGLGVVIWISVRGLHVLDGLIFRATRRRHTFASLATGLAIVMLTTTGAKTAKRRTVPVIGLADDSALVVFASNWGQVKHPSWYYNLRVNPAAEVAWRDRVWHVDAREAGESERERLWNGGLNLYPTWSTYARRAGSRRIPIVVLTPRSAEAPGPQ